MKSIFHWSIRLSIAALALHLASAEYLAWGQTAREEGRSRVIYGTDDRKDWYEINDKTILSLARASVALIKSTDIQAGGGDVRLKTQSLKEVHNLCADQKYASQPAGAFCSGTLVGPDLVLTAGHCVREVSKDETIPAITSVRFIFGYRMESRASQAAIGAAQVFAGKEVIDGTMSRDADDWALVRLAEPVPATVAEPVAAWDAQPVKKDQKIFVIGFPSGVPLKYAPGAAVRDASRPGFFVANLDTFGGNSGSGVYDQETNNLIGVLVRGETDYKTDQIRKCNIVNDCPINGCRGEDVTRISSVRRPAAP